MRFLSPEDRRGYAQLLNDLALDFAERFNEARDRHEQEMRLLRGTLERQQGEIRDLKKQLEEKGTDGSD